MATMGRWVAEAGMHMAFGLMLSGCAGPEPPGGAARPSADEASSSPSTDTVPGFANTVWKVARSTAGDPGALYVFLGDGTLLIASANGTPALGQWRRTGDSLTMVEEGLPHPVTVLAQSADSFNIKIASPGDPVEIHFVPGAPRGTARGKGQ